MPVLFTGKPAGHAYGSVYGGPIGAILTPQLQSMEHSQTLPYASSLCGACYEVCPVKINIPEILIHLRRRVSRTEAMPFQRTHRDANGLFRASNSSRFSAAQKLIRIGQWPFEREGKLENPPGMLRAWTAARDLPQSEAVVSVNGGPSDRNGNRMSGAREEVYEEYVSPLAIRR